MLQPRQIPLSTHRDERGALTEIFRKDWVDVPAPVQWNFVRSEANVLRGVHVHVTHVDTVPMHAECWLTDLRADSAGHNQGALVELSADNLSMLMIPVWHTASTLPTGFVRLRRFASLGPGQR